MVYKQEDVIESIGQTDITRADTEAGYGNNVSIVMSN